MRFLLSVKTVFPRPGGKVWYDDQREVHGQIYGSDDSVDYAFWGRIPMQLTIAGSARPSKTACP